MRVLPRSVPVLALVGIAVAFGFIAASPGGGGTVATSSAGSWRGLVGEPRAAVPTGSRMIVVLSTPSVAQKLAKVRYATEAQERAWWASAIAAQKQVLLKLAALGINVAPDYSFYRVLDGFSAALDPRAVSLLEQMPEVSGIYPVRATFPASVSSSQLDAKAYGAGSGHRPDVGVPGFGGHGVTIALLDTGVDASHPYLHGHVLPGVDVLDRDADASPRANPANRSQLEQHGTELAGILVGSDGPGGLRGVAPEATVLPIRVAGWQADADGHELVYGRSDQLIAGLDRAVDPNGDGDEHDATRIALVGVTEPYAAFTDGPEAQAVQGALDLNTLVVTPAGNDGGAGPAFGSVAGPAGAPGALAVAATDGRAAQPQVRIVLRRGLDVIFDRRVPLLGAVGPAGAAAGPAIEPNVGPAALSFLAGATTIVFKASAPCIVCASGSSTNAA